MGEFLQPLHLMIVFLIFPISFAVIIVPVWQIFRKAGFAPALSLLMVVPLVNLALLYYIGFSEWRSARS